MFIWWQQLDGCELARQIGNGGRTKGRYRENARPKIEMRSYGNFVRFCFLVIKTLL
jgi:hypothetical protein